MWFAGVQQNVLLNLFLQKIPLSVVRLFLHLCGFAAET